MTIANLNQEWDFIVTETHGGKPSETNLAKREILFALQILLNRIGLSTQESITCTLRQDYSVLKEIYLSEKLHNGVKDNGF